MGCPIMKLHLQLKCLMETLGPRAYSPLASLFMSCLYIDELLDAIVLVQQLCFRSVPTCMFHIKHPHRCILGLLMAPIAILL